MKSLIPALLFFIISGFLFVGLYKDPSLVSSPLVGKSMPSFSASTLFDAHKTVTEADIIGEIALLNVWATWCPACKQEHPDLVALAINTDIPIYGLNYKETDKTEARSWLRDEGNPYVFSIADDDGRIAIDFGVYGAPETFLIDAKGVIRYKRVGVMNDKIWQRDFLPIIQRLRREAL
ncbi:MAG: DsbE family thiol:disulfide interchange protein [Gammaproteobacteria bacterium]|nr:DsbE family thiol:disulfide interchange protein [Gammaproteobacteria bacterium]